VSSLFPRMDKGPQEVLRALLSGDQDQVREALEFQRESFRAKFGCYPEECNVTESFPVTEADS